MDSRAFSINQITRLLDWLALQINDTLESHTPEAVHDLRVATRRFNQALAVSKPFLPPHTVRAMYRRGKVLMTLAGTVRDCDIAIKLVTLSKAKDAAVVTAKLRTRRTDAQKVLAASLNEWIAANSFSKWRRTLGGEASAGNSQAETVEVTARRELPRLAQAFFRDGRHAASPAASTKDI